MDFRPYFLHHTLLYSSCLPLPVHDWTFLLLPCKRLACKLRNITGGCLRLKETLSHQRHESASCNNVQHHSRILCVCVRVCMCACMHVRVCAWGANPKPRVWTTSPSPPGACLCSAGVTFKFQAYSSGESEHLSWGVSRCKLFRLSELQYHMQNGAPQLRSPARFLKWGLYGIIQ